uniref:Uncharacterized protein n=1 Tax=Glossina pallidipes TaxID=7398 RepID=A0A1A9Z2F7_GLOPL
MYTNPAVMLTLFPNLITFDFALSRIQELNSSRGVYPWQTFKPNCNELQYICGIISEKIKRRLEILNKNRESVERDEKPNEWCAYRIELSTSQRIEKCSKSAELVKQRLQETQTFM